MKVVLRSDVDGVGKKGDMVTVADGFARNYLIPKGQAIVATGGIEAQAQAMRRSRDLRDAKDREAAETVARSLVAKVITIPAKAGAEGRLFGSVTAQDIVGAVLAQSGVQLDRRKLNAEPIKTMGSHLVAVRLHPEVQFSLNVEVTPTA
ncbi:MAG TPA: 50S ribosomal protein L9 [Acidimicrobiales bacterium]|nr:50S ribosomal protein L9 [Acidimicrobiales bacterium]